MIILNRFNGQVIFEFECNSKKECVLEAIKQKADLRGAKLRGADLSEANLSEADFTGADLTGADLRLVRCENTVFKNCILNEANLGGSKFIDTDFSGVIMYDIRTYDSVCGKASFKSVNFSKTIASSVSFKYIDLIDCNFKNADLYGADFEFANLLGVNFKGSDLANAKFYNTNLKHTNFKGSFFLGEKLRKNIIYLKIDGEHEILITDTKIKINFFTYSTDAWEIMPHKNIVKMKKISFLDWKKWKEPILLMAKTHQKI